MRRPARTVLAALAGYAVFWGSARLAALSAGLAFPQAGTPFPTTPFLAVDVAIGFLGAIVAGYACARTSPAADRLASLTLLVVVVLAAAVATARLSPPAPREPAGFLPLVTMLGVIGLWTGAMVERAVRGGRST